MDPAAAALKVLHGLTVVRIVGHGGDGQVYSATNKAGEYVAIKMMQYGGGDPRAFAEARRKAENESAGWSKIGYETQILHLQSYRTLAFVMPLLEGLSLKQHARNGVLWDRLQGSKMAVLYFEQLVLLHSRRLSMNPLAHRDIKPSNVMIIQRPVRRRRPTPSPPTPGTASGGGGSGGGRDASGSNDSPGKSSLTVEDGDKTGGVDSGGASSSELAAEASGGRAVAEAVAGAGGGNADEVEFVPVIIDWGAAHVAKPDGSQDVRFPGQPTGSRGYFGPDINKARQTYNIDVYASTPIVLHFLRYQGDCSLLKAQIFDQMKRISASTQDIVKQEQRCELYERAARAPFPIVEVAFEFYRSDPEACRLLINFLARMQAPQGRQRPSSLQCLKFFLRLHEYFFLVDGGGRGDGGGDSAAESLSSSAAAATEEEAKDSRAAAAADVGEGEGRAAAVVGGGGGGREGGGGGGDCSCVGEVDTTRAIADVLRELAVAAGEVPREVPQEALPVFPSAEDGRGGAGGAGGGDCDRLPPKHAAGSGDDADTRPAAGSSAADLPPPRGNSQRR